MGLKDILEKMKLVEVDVAAHVPPPAPGTAKAASAASIDEILNSLPPPPKIDGKALPDAAAGSGSSGLPDFPSVYKAAGVADPGHGYGIYKVMEIFASEGFVGLDLRARAAALMGFLKMNPTGPVPIKDVIQDAIRRDQALDGYEEFFRKKIEGKRSEIERENADLQAEIDAVILKNRERMESNLRMTEQERQRFAEWQAMKRVEEKRLFDAVAPFVEANPITLGPSAPPAAPEQTKK